MSGFNVRWPRDLRLRPIQSWPGAPTRARIPAPFRASWADTVSLLSRELTALMPVATSEGSCIVVLATDAPLSARQCRRMARNER